MPLASVILIYLPYGLAFFLLGLAAFFVRPPGNSVGPEFDAFYWLGWFGLVHGLAEWIALCLFSGAFAAAAGLLRAMLLCANLLSFGFLLWFGIRLNCLRSSGFRKLEGKRFRGAAILLPACIILAAVFFIQTRRLALDQVLDAWSSLDGFARIFLALPGGLLSAVGLWRAGNGQRADSALRWPLRGLAVIFVFYAMVAGLLWSSAMTVPGFTAVPKELFRTVAALAAAILMLLMFGRVRRLWLKRLWSLRELEVLQAERERLGRDLHDRVIQLLFAASLRLDAMQAPDETGRQDIRELAGLIRHASRELRAFIKPGSGSPLRLDLFCGLVSETCRELRRIHGLRLEFQHNLPAVEPDKTAGLLVRSPEELLGILHEAVGNVVRHASVRAAAVRLAAGNGRMELSVRDSGRGFDVAKVQVGNGLVSIKKRTELLGGRLIIDSAPGRGTAVSVSVPLLTDTPDGSGEDRNVS